MSLSPRTRSVLFLVLTYGFSSIFYARIIADGKLRMLPTLGLMWCPGLAAIILRLATQKDLRGTGWAFKMPRLQFLSYVLPPALALAVYGITWITGIGGFNGNGISVGNDSPIPVSPVVLVGMLATLGMIQAAIFALGEEIGWRGFLVPELAKTNSFTATALISGVAWSAYHYPLILFANYHGNAPKWFAMIAFTWMVMACSFVYAWMRLKSGSVWTGVILHASHNLFVQSIFDPLTSERGFTKYVTTEFGVGLAIAYTIVAIYFWRRRGEVEPNSTEAAVTAHA